MGQQHCRTVWQFLIKLNMYLPYDPDSTFSSFYPREMKTYIYKNKKTTSYQFYSWYLQLGNYSNVYQQVCGYMNRVKLKEYYSAIKKNVLMVYLVIRVILKRKYAEQFYLYYILKQGKPTDNNRKHWWPGTGGGQDWV